jgi:hypothetical protein
LPTFGILVQSSVFFFWWIFALWLRDTLNFFENFHFWCKFEKQSPKKLEIFTIVLNNEIEKKKKKRSDLIFYHFSRWVKDYFIHSTDYDALSFHMSFQISTKMYLFIAIILQGSSLNFLLSCYKTEFFPLTIFWTIYE